MDLLNILFIVKLNNSVKYGFVGVWSYLLLFERGGKLYRLFFFYLQVFYYYYLSMFVYNLKINKWRIQLKKSLDNILLFLIILILYFYDHLWQSCTVCSSDVHIL